jgi:GcrA cell cycle regulator
VDKHVQHLVLEASTVTVCGVRPVFRKLPTQHIGERDQGMAWTDERVERLRRLWTDGLSASQIAKELGGVTRNAVIGKVHRLGLSGRAAPSRPPERQVKRTRPRAAIAPQRIAIATPARKPLAAEAPVEIPMVATDAPMTPAKLPSGEFATVLNLSEHICKWPIGDPSDAEFRFCGRKAKSGAPYCEGHCQVAFQAPKRRRRGESTAQGALDAIAAHRRLSW